MLLSELEIEIDPFQPQLSEESKEVDTEQKVNKRKRLRKTVELNRRSLGKMSEKKQAETCAICLSDILIENEVRLDSCVHKYCGACIK